MRSRIVLLGLTICAMTVVPAYGQYRDSGFEVGVHGGVAYDLSTGIQDMQPGMVGRLSVAFPILPPLQGELGAGYAELRGRDLFSVLTPAEMLLKVAPFYVPGFIPYLFAGGGVLYYRWDKQPSSVPVNGNDNGYVPYVPAGVGMQFRITPRAALDFRGTYNQFFTDDLSPSLSTDDDSYVTVLAGVRFSTGGGDKDIDDDGLLNRDEKKARTDPKNPDTDGDGLNDGEEHIGLHTNPLVKDTDDDGLDDFAEVKTHNTDPFKQDTDDDGLKDSEEALQYMTNPLKSDGDNDGASDRDEVMTHKTDPNKEDTDGDGLTDGMEINKHKTDPLKMDTDGGTVADGLEVERRTNPLDPKDDVPPPPEPQVIIVEKEVPIVFEMEKPVVLEGINFAFDSDKILPESEKVLNQALESMREHEEVVVEISGHTDNVGSDSYNQNLSERRANSVRNWMIAHGIDAGRMTAVGYGESRPIDTNETEDGRLRNRRIEFKRIR